MFLRHFIYLLFYSLIVTSLGLSTFLDFMLRISVHITNLCSTILGQLFYVMGQN
jgi:hypothetical protein